jgi:hypothetical protein
MSDEVKVNEKINALPIVAGDEAHFRVQLHGGH